MTLVISSRRLENTGHDERIQLFTLIVEIFSLCNRLRNIDGPYEHRWVRNVVLLFSQSPRILRI